MISIGPVSFALLAKIIVSGFFAVLLPSAAHAACAEGWVWLNMGKWKAVQSNGPAPVISWTTRTSHATLVTEVQGKAEYTQNFGPLVSGSLDGTIIGDNVKFTVYWDNGDKGVYTGIVGSQGRVEGWAYDARHPESTATWYSDETFRCLSTSFPKKPESPPVDTKTYQSLGRVKVAPTTLKTPIEICVYAQNARKRNSPAAPGLERQCAAAGGP